MIDTTGHRLPALSIKQPWADLIIRGHKAIENRSWSTKYRGEFLIHTGKKFDGEAIWHVHLQRNPLTGAPYSYGFEDFDFQTGGIIGVAELVDCVTTSSDPFFCGKYGFVLRNARPIPFVPCLGKLGFFDPGIEVNL